MGYKSFRPLANFMVDRYVRPKSAGYFLKKKGSNC
jgi:hypothetical protein